MRLRGKRIDGLDILLDGIGFLLLVLGAALLLGDVFAVIMGVVLCVFGIMLLREHLWPAIRRRLGMKDKRPPAIDG